MRAIVLAALTLLTLGGCTLLVGGPDPRDTSSSPDLSLTPCADVQSDPHNCGACGHDCGRLPGVDPTKVGCIVGVCDLRGACLSARADCSGGYADGCETDLTTAAHCGSCSAQCSGTTALCARDNTGAFFCAGSCPSTSPTQCGSACIDTANDPAHCGACGTSCPSGTGQIAVCQNSVCSTSCKSGFHVCSGTCADSTSVNSCGTRCTPCPAPPNNAVEICDTFAGCTFQCNNGFTQVPGGCSPASGPQDLAMRDMMSSTLPLCDCTGLMKDSMGNQCSVTNQCVGNNCCEEDQLECSLGSCPSGTCIDMTPCTTSPTPQ